jgi:uncharacterized cupredoxin-like copper-binding protein
MQDIRPKSMKWKEVPEMMRRWIFVVLLLAIGVLAACGGGGDEEPVATEAAAPPSAQQAIAAVLEVTMADLYYGETPDNLTNPPVWTVKAGDAVQVNMTNKGALQHNWAIAKLGSEVPVPFMPETNGDLLEWDAGLVDPGEQATATFTAPVAGEYQVICTVAGHYPSMQGKLVVQ